MARHASRYRNFSTHRGGSQRLRLLIEDQSAGEKYDTNGRAAADSLESEQAKWERGDHQAIETLPEAGRPIFVHARGADAFSYFH